MRFLEYEVWRLNEGCPMAEYERMIETWFTYVVRHKDTLFPEWVSAKYFKQCNEEGEFNGVYVMLFEYESLEAHHAYKIRKRKSYERNDGVYAEYAANDPYQFFDTESVSIEYLQPQHEGAWFDFTEEKRAEEKRAGTEKTRYLEYEYWQLAEGVDMQAYEDIIDVWFAYVAEHKKRLFDEWVSARYYRFTDVEGRPNGRYAMIFEYASHPEFQAYKKRRRHSYDTDTGDYLVYRDNDPYQFFNTDTVGTDGLWPQKTGLWFDFSKQ